MYKIIILLLVTLSCSAFAQIDGKQFVDCFERAVNESAAEIRQEGGDTTRLCTEISKATKYEFEEYFSKVEGTEIVFFSAHEMGELYLLDLFDTMVSTLDCYGPKMFVREPGVISTVVNTLSRYRNNDLLHRAFDKMVGGGPWDGAFAEFNARTLSEYDLSYCK